MVTNRRNKFPPISQCTLSVVVCENYTVLLSKAVRTRSRLWAPSCHQFGVLSLLLRTFRHGGSILWENVQISAMKKTIALWKLPALNHNHSVGMKQGFPWDFFTYFSFMCLLTCERDSPWWKSWCCLTYNTFWVKLSSLSSFISLLWHYLCCENDKEPFNGSEVGSGWHEMACFLIKPLMTIKEAAKFFYYNT